MKVSFVSVSFSFFLLAFGLCLNAVSADEREEKNQSAKSDAHPLDDLTKDEIVQVVNIIKSSLKYSEDIRFSVVMNREPKKEEILKWEKEKSATHLMNIPREALVVLLDKKKNLLWEAIVNLQTQTITSYKELKNRHPSILLEDYDTATTLVNKDPRWQKAMKKRGITNLEDIYIDVWAPGLLSEKEKKSGVRLARLIPFYKGKGENVYARPIEGVIGIVDLNSSVVLEVWDSGEVFPLPKGLQELDEESNAPLRTDLKPLKVSQPEGPSFQIKGQQVDWQNWRFRFSMSPTKGLVLYQVQYLDKNKNSSHRSILYKGILSEMIVPYGETGKNWTFRNALDVGEYGIGISAHPMVPHEDLPGNAVFLDAVFADSVGVPFTITNAMAIYERDGGLLWKHYDTTTEKSYTRRARQLVMTFMTTIGNYDYGIDWVFHQDGTLEMEARLTGILLTKGTNFKKNLCENGCKHLVEPFLMAPNHQHFFCFRLDLDVEGAGNNIPVEINTKSIPRGKKNPAGNAFEMDQTYLKREKAATRDLNFMTSRRWKIIDPDAKNQLGHPVGYALIPGENSIPYLHPQSPVRKEAAFINHPIWFTQYNDEEQSAAGDYPNQKKVKDGLSQWIADNSSLERQDVVLWYTFGVTHLARPEEWPVMPVHKTGFKLVPVNFFSRNPAMDVPVSK